MAAAVFCLPFWTVKVHNVPWTLCIVPHLEMSLLSGFISLIIPVLCFLQQIEVEGMEPSCELIFLYFMAIVIFLLRRILKKNFQTYMFLPSSLINLGAGTNRGFALYEARMKNYLPGEFHLTTIIFRSWRLSCIGLS